MKNYVGILIGIVIAVVTLFLIYLINLPSIVPQIGNQTNRVLGSISNRDAYSATTTTSWVQSTTATTSKVLSTTPGVFGSVVITGTGASYLACYDATTTTQGGNGNVAFATTTLASFVGSTAAGTYTFDTGLGKGLLCEMQSPGLVSATITWK